MPIGRQFNAQMMQALLEKAKGQAGLAQAAGSGNMRPTGAQRGTDYKTWMGMHSNLLGQQDPVTQARVMAEYVPGLMPGGMGKREQASSVQDALLYGAMQKEERDKELYDLQLEKMKAELRRAKGPGKKTRSSLGGLGRSQGQGGRVPRGDSRGGGRGGGRRAPAAPSYEQQLALKNQYEMERLRQLLATLGKPKGESVKETTDQWVKSAGRFLNKPVTTTRRTDRDYTADILRAFL